MAKVANTASNYGLTAGSSINGQTATSTTTFGTGSDHFVDQLSTAPDGTKVLQRYRQGLLLLVQNLGTDDSVISSQSYDYDALGRVNKVTDPRLGRNGVRAGAPTAQSLKSLSPMAAPKSSPTSTPRPTRPPPSPARTTACSRPS